MADFSITQAVGAGPGLILRRPFSVLAWGLLPAIVFIPILLLFGGAILGAVIMAIHARSGDASAAVGPIFSAIGALVRFLFFAIIAGWAVTAVISAAVFRAVLEPERSAFAYLRFGEQELSLMLVSLVMFLVFLGIGIALAIPSSIITLAAAGSPRSVQLSLLALVTLARNAISIWIWLRLCMATPMTFAERRFRLFDSWAMTRGHALELFAVFVLAFLIVGLIQVVAFALGFSSLLLAGGFLPAFRANPQAFLANPQAIVSAIGPALIIWAALYAVVAGMASAVVRAPLAYIYRALSGTDVTAPIA